MEKNIKIDDITLCYDESGPDGAPPVILMHGWGCNYTTVASIANALNSKLKVYSLDLPGHGKSQEPPTAWGIEKFTKLVEKFCKALKIERPILIGHSFGGRISILMASRNNIDKVVLVDAAGIKPKRSLKYYFKVYSFKTARKILPYIVGKKKAEKIINAWRGKAGSADYRQSSPVMRAVMSVCVNEDLKHVMPDIKAPTLLIWGENDTATPLSDAKTMEKLIPDTGLVSFPDCGHYSFLDNPGQFRAVIQSFLLKK
ncbi:MAG: alpha/beta hydrolase [Muribaculaceae bacterium]|nr:alpha/beta hydrolase [Muribaculaceae bacterium]